MAPDDQLQDDQPDRDSTPVVPGTRRLIHLNGAPGVGKSTLAERYVAEHPGTLNCDIDRLRNLIGGWQQDFEGTGHLVRPLALAMITAHLRNGGDVVLPQLLVDPAERAKFAQAARQAGADYVHVLLRAAPGVAADRFLSAPRPASMP